MNGVKTESPMPKSNLPMGLGTLPGRQIPDSGTARIVGSSSFDGAFTANGLLEDYEQLRIRCVDLSKMCSRGITLAMGKASIEESRKAIEQSQRLKKLTILATLFIPLSFSTSLFGMNVDLLEQSAVQLWWFFVVCIPITLISYVFYLWDFQVLRRWPAKFWKRCRDVGQGMTVRRGDKDTAYVV